MTIDAQHALQTVSSDAVVDNLVTQFANQWDCVRELVQNCLDAGTTRIDVWTEYLPGDGFDGTIALHIDDFGDGMDENIIDNQLTKLFASSKEGDLTKIGKFGIGFVSIFALKPEAVLLHTGRGGEYWEVLFHADRTFSKTRLENPIEGTQITLFLKGDRNAYLDATQQVRRTLSKWCKHSETEIYFEDRESGTSELINEAFEVRGVAGAHLTPEPGTEIVIAFHDEPEYEFFNRGLTIASTKIAENVMHEGRADRFRYIGYKVKSRYLEHTLSRDTVLRDDNYTTVMHYLDEAATTISRLLAVELAELVARPHWTPEDLITYGRLLRFLSTEYGGPSDRKIFRGLHGQNYSAGDLYRAWQTDGRILLDEVPTELSKRLSEANVPVVFGSVGMGGTGSFPWSSLTEILLSYASKHAASSLKGAVIDFFSSYRPRIARGLMSPRQVYVPVNLDEEVVAELAPFLEDTHRVLVRGLGPKLPPFTTFKPLDAVSVPIFLVHQAQVGRLKLPPQHGSVGQAGTIAVNREHPHFLLLLRLYAVEKQMASYCLAKALLLQDDRDLAMDAALMSAAREAL
jgi:hypothetical protein